MTMSVKKRKALNFRFLQYSNILVLIIGSFYLPSAGLPTAC